MIKMGNILWESYYTATSRQHCNHIEKSNINKIEGYSIRDNFKKCRFLKSKTITQLE